MWLQQHHQSLLTELFQAALVKLCLENVPFSGNLELDGLFCISNDEVSKQIVVKIHKVIQPSSANHGKSRSILKINQTADEYGKQKDTALVVEVRRGKVGDGIIYKSEHSCGIGSSTKDSIPANRDNDKSAKTDSMMLEVPSNLAVASKNGSGIIAVDLSINSPSAQGNTGCSVGISHIKEEQLQEMCMCDEESVGESLQIRDNDDIHSSEMQCRHCRLNNFTDLGDLETHLRENHGRFVCRRCLKTFSLSCNLRRHMKLHTGVRPHVCNSCNSSFSRSTDLKLHMKKHSSGKDSFSCSLCSVIFSNSYLLCQHKAKFHGSDEEWFKCATCEKQFSSESNLMLHQKVHRESCGSEVDKSALNQSPNMTSDEQAGEKDETSFEDGSSGSPGLLQSPASWTAHLSEKVCLAKETVEHMEEKQNLPLDFKINHFPSKLGKEMSNAYIETVKEFVPLYSIDDLDVANGSCSRDFCAKSSENLPRALSLVHKRLSFATPAVGKNKRKGMPLKHVKLNENEASYETSDGHALHHNNESDDDDDDSDGNVSNGNIASNCEGVICKTNSNHKLQLNERNMDSSHDGLKDREFSMSKLHKSAFLLHRNEANIRLEKQGESHSASSDLSLNNNNAESRIFTCRHGGCSTAWFGFAAYESHYISAHCRYPCELCDQSFTSRNNRRRHANGHGNAKKHNCDRCDKQFARPDIVKEHRITHTKSYQSGCCFKCDFACVKKTMLLSHLKRCLAAEDVDSDIAKL